MIASETMSGADAMGKMDGDLRIPVIGHEPAEHQGEVGNRQAGVRVPHGRAHENLDVNQHRRRRRQAPEQAVVHAFVPRVSIGAT